MKTLIDESRTLYAAIQARRSDGPADRFVISYTSEKALRGLFAAPSIVASGCATRERAEELCRGEIPTRVWDQQSIYGFSVNVSRKLARILWIVFGRAQRLVPLLGHGWHAFSEKPLHVGRANA